MARKGRGGHTKWQLIKFWSPLDYSDQNGFYCNQIVVIEWFWVPLNYGDRMVLVTIKLK